jgi:hypothetical protein
MEFAATEKQPLQESQLQESPPQSMTKSEIVGWVILAISLIVGFGMTAIAPN